MGEGVDVTNLSAIDLSRYHDLTKRLAVFDTDGGLVSGDGSDLTFTPEGNEQMFAGEQELARLAGHIEVVGPRSIKRGEPASMGTVMIGPGLLIVTSYRLIAMCQSEKTQSQLGSGRANHVHTIVFLWDLIDSVFMPAKKKMSDRLAGNRMITAFSAVTMGGIRLIPVVREIDGKGAKIADDAAFAVLAEAGANRRKSVAPLTEHSRLDQILGGAYTTDSEGDLVAELSDPGTTELPVHLIGRLVETVGDRDDTSEDTSKDVDDRTSPTGMGHGSGVPGSTAQPVAPEVAFEPQDGAPVASVGDSLRGERSQSKQCTCGTNLKSDAAFCSSCGRAQDLPAASCSACGEPFEEVDKFCVGCGRPRGVL